MTGNANFGSGKKIARRNSKLEVNDGVRKDEDPSVNNQLENLVP